MTIKLFTFNEIEKAAQLNGDYSVLNLCANNNAAIELANDDTTARVIVRVPGEGWCTVYAFQIESWEGSHWSDIDIDRALSDDFALMSYLESTT